MTDYRAPWSIKQDGEFFEVMADDGLVADCYEIGVARLILAVPDMLDALKRVSDYICYEGSNVPEYVMDAIAKAEGRA